MIRSIAIRRYRTIHAVELDLVPGLNAIHGDNEIGKSTVRQAVQAALFQPSTVSGKTLNAMQPYDGGTPEVALRFEHRGIEYDVEKTFAGRRGTTCLAVREPSKPMRQLNGDAAEATLRAVLGVGDTKNIAARDGASYAPIMWVSQQASGTSFDADLDEDGRRALGQRLGELSGIALGTLAGGAFDQAIERAYDEFFTAKTGKESESEASPLHRARAELTSADRELQQVAALWKSREAELDEYATVVDRIRAIERQLPRLEAAVVAADAVMAEAERLQSNVLDLGRQASEAKAGSTYQEQVMRRRQELRDRTDKVSADLDASTRTVGQARAVLATHDTARSRVLDGCAVEEAQLDESAVAMRRLQGQVEHATVRERTTQNAARLAKARTAHADLVAARVRVAALRVDDAAMNEIDRLQHALERAEDRLRNAATGLRMTALREVSVTADGEDLALAPGQPCERVADGPLTLRIADLLDIEVLPGGQTLGSLASAVPQARKQLQDALARVGVPDLAATRAQLDERKNLEPEIRRNADLLASFAPEGVETLSESLAVDLARAKHLEDELGPDASAIDGPQVVAALRAAQSAYDGARHATASARKALEAHDEQRVAFATTRSNAETTLEGSRVAMTCAAQALDEHVIEHGDDTAIVLALDEARVTTDARTHALADAERKLEAMLPSVLQADAARARKAQQCAENELHRDRERRAGLDRVLCSADAIDLHERIDAARAREERARRECDALAARAKAVRVLRDTIEDSRRETEERFREPLQQRFTPMLRALFPDARVALDESYRIVQIERDRVVDRFEDLSDGAREQVGIIGRLAMADVLAAEDRVCVLLDDALAFTSDRRFARMASVLALAAARMQIIVFTSDWERYRTAGVDCAIDLGAAMRARRDLAAQ